MSTNQHYSANATKLYLDDPPIVDILEWITGDLLLVTGTSLVGVFEGIYGLMRVKPAWRLSERVTQCDLRPNFHERRLPFDNRRQPAFEGRLQYRREPIKNEFRRYYCTTRQVFYHALFLIVGRSVRLFKTEAAREHKASDLLFNLAL